MTRKNVYFVSLICFLIAMSSCIDMVREYHWGVILCNDSPVKITAELIDEESNTAHIVAPRECSIIGGLNYIGQTASVQISRSGKNLAKLPVKAGHEPTNLIVHFK